MTETPSSPRFVSEKLFTDPTPDGIINQRILQHSLLLAKDLTDLDENELSEFFGTSLYLGIKLASTWQHLNRYVSVETQLLEQVKKAPPGDAKVFEIEYSQELFQEFDEFVVQLKSALDHLVKIGRPILGARVWNVQRFGDKGRDVEKALSNNLPKKYQAAIPEIIQFLFERNRDWLETTIQARDKINHFIKGGIRVEEFGVYVLPDGTIQVPRWSSDQDLRTAMEAIWTNTIHFTEDFIAHFLHFRHREGLTLFHGPEPEKPTESPWKVVLEKQLRESLEKAVAQRLPKTQGD